MKKLLFIILLTIPFIGFGQGWEKTFGDIETDKGRCVQQTTDGGYIITGVKTPSVNDSGDLWLIKTDGNGIEQWNKTFSSSTTQNFLETGYSVRQTTDGGYIITGKTHSSMGNIWLIKTDGNGDSVWEKTFGSGMGTSVQQTSDGGYIITGGTTTNLFGDIFLIKTDGNGDSLWIKTFDGFDMNSGSGVSLYDEIKSSVQQTTDGGYIITGTRGFDILLLKTDGNGIEQWSKTFGITIFGDSINCRGYSVQQTTDGGYIISGGSNTYLSSNGFYYNQSWLIKTDSTGTEQWNQHFGPSHYGDGKYVQQTTDGGYIITGNGGFGSGNGLYLIKTNNNGIKQWVQKFVGLLSNGFHVEQTSDGGYIICGETKEFGNGERDVYLIKTDGNGNITSTFNIPTPSSNRKLEKVVDILGKETKLQTNTPFIEIYDDGSIEKKLIIE